jgi:2-amino-4-hydroxy-6-hydroxymethyldihydropteridine diphosphokinase
MPQALIGLGSNLGDRHRNLQAALDALAASDGIRLLAASGRHETQPIGGPAGQAPFLNAAATLETSLPPEVLLARLQEIETRLGRTRGERWSARPLDLDLLLYDDVVLQTPQLALPHPRMAFRRFVLQGAVEIAPAMRHPLIGWSISQLWEHLITAPLHVAIAGADAATRSALAHRLAGRLPNRPGLTIDESWSDPSAPPAGREAAKPKLILWLDAPEDPRREQITQRIHQPDVGPWLRLDSSDLDAAVDEAVAAIQAMQ